MSRQRLLAEVQAVFDGKHPMFDRSAIVDQLDAISKRAAELGVSIEDKPVSQVLSEIKEREQGKAETT